MKADKLSVFAVIYAAFAAALLVADWIIAMKQGEKDYRFLIILTGIFLAIFVGMAVDWWRTKRRK